MAEADINRFLTHLAVTEQVSASTQNQALAALLFLYRYVIGRNVGDLGEVIRARKSERLPVVMTREEVKAVLANLTGDKWLMTSITKIIGAIADDHIVRVQPRSEITSGAIARLA